MVEGQKNTQRGLHWVGSQCNAFLPPPVNPHPCHISWCGTVEELLKCNVRSTVQATKSSRVPHSNKVFDTLPSVGNHAISQDGLLRHYGLEISNVPPDPTGSTLPLLCLAYRSRGSVRVSMRCLSPAGHDPIEVDKKREGMMHFRGHLPHKTTAGEPRSENYSQIVVRYYKASDSRYMRICFLLQYNRPTVHFMDSKKTFRSPCRPLPRF